MKKFITVATLLAGAGLSGQAMASGASDCHFHGNAVATQATVSTCAAKYQKDLIASGKIAKSWLRSRNRPPSSRSTARRARSGR